MVEQANLNDSDVNPNTPEKGTFNQQLPRAPLFDSEINTSSVVDSVNSHPPQAKQSSVQSIQHISVTSSHFDVDAFQRQRIAEKQSFEPISEDSDELELSNLGATKRAAAPTSGNSKGGLVR